MSADLSEPTVAADDPRDDDFLPHGPPGELPLLMAEPMVCRFLDISSATLYRLIARGDFPKGVKLAPKYTRWHRDVVRRYALLEARHVAAELSISTNYFREMVKAGRFPEANVTTGRDRWWKSTVENWVRKNVLD